MEKYPNTWQCPECSNYVKNEYLICWNCNYKRKKKQNLTERTVWICEKCGKKHEMKTCFCDECGTERNKKHIITSSTPVSTKSNSEAINLFIIIIIISVCLWILVEIQNFHLQLF